MEKLSEMRKTYCSKGSHLVKETKISLDGIPGEDFIYTYKATEESETIHCRTRHYLKNSYYYELTVSSPPGRPLPDDATRFLSSLTFEALVNSSAQAWARPGARAQPGSGARRSSQGRDDSSKAVLKVDLIDGKAEDALKTFMLALAAHDEKVLRAVTLPDAEFDVLLKDRVPPIDPKALGEMRSRLDRTPFRRLHAGDRVRMPDGRVAVIKPADVSIGRIVLQPEGSALPTRLENIGGHWKVFVKPIIAARKALLAKRGNSAQKP
jgi:hypothetical protein